VYVTVWLGRLCVCECELNPGWMPTLPVSHQRKVRADGRLKSERKEEEKENKRARQRGGDSLADFGDLWLEKRVPC